MTGFVARHLMHGVVDRVEVQRLCALGEIRLAYIFTIRFCIALRRLLRRKMRLFAERVITYIRIGKIHILTIIFLVIA